LREAQTESELGFILVNDTRSLIPYRVATLWLLEHGAGDRGRIASVSGSVEHDPQSPFLQWMAPLCRAVSSAAAGKLREFSKADVPQNLQGQWDTHGTARLVWCPLRSAGGVYLGGLALWREKAMTESEQRILSNWLSAAGYCLAALRGKAFSSPGFVWTSRRKQIAIGVVAALSLLMFMPVHLSVLAQAEVVARNPLVVRSPLDGIIDSIHVRPNTVVEKGALLVKLDDTELQTRLDVSQQALAISVAQYQQAGQSAAFDANAKASLRVLALEGEKRQSEVAYVKALIERSDVEAEQAGVVMMPDPDELIGKPVVTGERLMTIADPKNAQLEAWLAVGDDISVLYDANLAFFPNVAPDKKFEARLRRLDYRAETTETGELAYRIRADFVSEAGLPRIGMRGTAKVYGEKVSLAYYLFRRPLATMRRWLGI